MFQFFIVVIGSVLKLNNVSIFYCCYRISVNAAFYGLSFNISFLFGDKYLNFAAGQVVDVLCISSLLLTVPR